MFNNYATYLERHPELVAMLLLSPAVIMSQLHANPRERVQLSKLLRPVRAEAFSGVIVDISKQERQHTAENDQVDRGETATLLVGSSAILGSFRGFLTEARTRGFPSPSFGGFGFVVFIS